MGLDHRDHRDLRAEGGQGEGGGGGGHIFKMGPKPIGSPIGQRIGRAPGSYWGQNGHPIGSPIGSTPKSNTCTLPFNESFILNCLKLCRNLLAPCVHVLVPYLSMKDAT